MKLVLLLVLIGMFTPVFAQDDTLENKMTGELFWSSVKDTVIIVAGIATALALGFLGYQTMMLRSERKLTLRAWLGTSEARVRVHGHFDQDEQFIHMEKWKNLSTEEKISFDFKKTRRYVEIKNYGQLPALKLRVRTKIILDVKTTRKDIESEQFASSSILMPQETVKIFFILTKEEELSIDDPTKEFFCIVEAEFESPENVKRKYGFIMNVSQQIYGTQDSWID